MEKSKKNLLDDLLAALEKNRKPVVSTGNNAEDIFLDLKDAAIDNVLTILEVIDDQGEEYVVLAIVDRMGLIPYGIMVKHSNSNGDSRINAINIENKSKAIQEYAPTAQRLIAAFLDDSVTWIETGDDICDLLVDNEVLVHCTTPTILMGKIRPTVPLKDIYSGMEAEKETLKKKEPVVMAQAKF